MPYGVCVGGGDGLLFYTNSLLPPGSLKVWHAWLEVQGPSTSLLDEENHTLYTLISGVLAAEVSPTSPQEFSRNILFGFKVQKVSFSPMGVKVAPPRSNEQHYLYKAPFLEVPRIFFALNPSFWSTDIMEVGLGSKAAQH